MLDSHMHNNTIIDTLIPAIVRWNFMVERVKDIAFFRLATVNRLLKIENPV